MANTQDGCSSLGGKGSKRSGLFPPPLPQPLEPKPSPSPRPLSAVSRQGCSGSNQAWSCGGRMTTSLGKTDAGALQEQPSREILHL